MTTLADFIVAGIDGTGAMFTAIFLIASYDSSACNLAEAIGMRTFTICHFAYLLRNGYCIRASYSLVYYIRATDEFAPMVLYWRICNGTGAARRIGLPAP
jgi:hypothetical protein